MIHGWRGCAAGALSRSRVGKVCRRVTHQLEYPSSPLSLAVIKDLEGISQGHDPEVLRFTSAMDCPIDPVKKCGNIAELGPMLKEVGIDHICT